MRKLINLALTVLLCISPVAASAPTPPDFTLTDNTGKPIHLASFKGKVVLLDFWATWCHGCKTEIPWYIEFANKYKQQGLSVIGVAMDDGGMAIVKPWLASHGVTYPIVIGNQALADKYKLEAMPMTLLIDRRGEIAFSHSGVVDKAAFESRIQTLLKQ